MKQVKRIGGIKTPHLHPTKFQIPNYYVFFRISARTIVYHISIASQTL